MIPAEGGAHGGNGDLRLAIVPNKGDDLFAEVGIEDRLHPTAMLRMRFFVVEAEAIDGVYGEDFDLAGLDEIAERRDESLAFEFPLIACTGGEADQRGSPVAVHDDTKLDAQPWRMPAMIFVLHLRPREGPRRKCGEGESMPA